MYERGPSWLMAITVAGSHFPFALIITLSPTANGLRVAVWRS